MIADVPLGHQLPWVPWLTLIAEPHPHQSYLPCAREAQLSALRGPKPVCRVCAFLEAAYRTLIDGESLWSGVDSEMVNIMKQAALSGSQLWQHSVKIILGSWGLVAAASPQPACQPLPELRRNRLAARACSSQRQYFSTLGNWKSQLASLSRRLVGNGSVGNHQDNSAGKIRWCLFASGSLASLCDFLPFPGALYFIMWSSETDGWAWINNEVGLGEKEGDLTFRTWADLAILSLHYWLGSLPQKEFVKNRHIQWENHIGTAEKCHVGCWGPRLILVPKTH